jgi:hypothetical protein
MNGIAHDDFSLEVLEPAVNRGYLSQVIPIARDEEIGGLLSQVMDEHRVARLTRCLQDGHAAVLRVFAERMASKAVRNHDVVALRLGLIALLLSGQRSDSRETILLFPIFYDAVRRIGLEIMPFAASIQQIIGDLLTAPLIEFLQRSETDKSLHAMGYSVGADADGFRYQRDW